MIKVLTGLDGFGRVKITMNGESVKHGWTDTANYKVNADKKGQFVRVKGVKHYIEIPQGEWIEVPIDGFGIMKKLIWSSVE